MKLVTLRIYNKAYEAHLAKQLLEDNGLASYIMDELHGEGTLTGGLAPLYTGVRLNVKKADHGKADLILKKNENKEMPSLFPERKRKPVDKFVMVILIIALSAWLISFLFF